jgi:NADPH-dependent ferric siderophore reductase
MPQISNGLDNTPIATVNGLSYSAIVKDTRFLSEDLLMVHFTGHFPPGMLYPGQQLSFFIDNSHIRPYTLASVDTEQHVYSVLFYLNGKGLGSTWTTTLQPGRTVSFNVMPGKLRYNERATHHFFFGDETAMGLFYGFKEMALQNNQEYFGVLELQPQNERVLNTLKLLVDCVPPSFTTPAAHAIHWMEDMHPNCWKAWKKATFYLAGSALAVQQFNAWLQEKQVAASRIQTLAYWSA